MKILHTMPDIDKEASGPSYSVIRLCESLIELQEHSQIALIGKGILNPYVRAFPPGIGPARLGRSPSMYRWLVQQVAYANVDIVHNHSLWMMPNVYPGWATKGSKIPYVVSPRGTFSKWAMRSGSKIKRIFWPLIQKPSLVHVACFHATSEAEYEDIRHMGFKQPVAIIPNGIDIPDYKKNMASNRYNLLFLGRLHAKKGVDLLLRAWEVLYREYPDWDLRVVGPKEHETAIALIKLAEKLELQRVDFSGPVYGEEKLDTYRNADLYVLPSYSENFAMTVAESLACGTPAVVSQGAPWHGLDRGGSGWWPEVGYAPLLGALRSAMSLPREELVCMGENGRRWMQLEFSWDGVGEKMRETYRWLLGKDEKPVCVELA